MGGDRNGGTPVLADMEIIYGSGGVFGAFIIGGLVVVAAIALLFLFTALKGARDQVIGEEEDDPTRSI